MIRFFILLTVWEGGKVVRFVGVLHEGCHAALGRKERTNLGIHTCSGWWWICVMDSLLLIIR